MKLYYTPRTSSLFPHIILHEAGLSKKIKVDEHTKLMDNGGDYRAVNPLGFVPALELDDNVLAHRKRVGSRPAARAALRKQRDPRSLTGKLCLLRATIAINPNPQGTAVC
jgi:hypothetical protein